MRKRRHTTHRPDPWPVATDLSAVAAEPPAVAPDPGPPAPEVQNPVQDPSRQKYLQQLDTFAPAANPWRRYPGAQELDPIIASAPLLSRYGTLAAQGHIAIDRGGQRPTYVSFMVKNRDRDVIDICYRGHDLSLAVEHINRLLTSDEYARRIIKNEEQARTLSVEDCDKAIAERQQALIEQRWHERLAALAGD
jgi:hypothetical protein